MKTVLLFVCLILIMFLSYGQNDTSTVSTVFTVKKVVPNVSAKFTYKGKPISPEALLPFLPGVQLDDTIRPWRVNLRDSIYSANLFPNGENGYSVTVQRIDEYGEYWESIAYRVVGKTSDDKFILDVGYNGGGTLTFPYIFVFKIVGDELVKIALFEAMPAYLQPVKVYLEGDTIYTGDKVYSIPK